MSEVHVTEHDAKILRWVDGDTVDVEAYVTVYPWPDVELKEMRRLRLRLTVADTPERGQPGYREATAFVNSLLPPGTETHITLYVLDNLSRWLADVRLSTETATTVSGELLRLGYAEIWH